MPGREKTNAELRNLFFDTADDLLQALNENGLHLERTPGEPALMREVRRIVHTLKGDAAACDFHELAELAHGLEDLLSAHLDPAATQELPRLVLQAADTFEAMLNAYRNRLVVPNAETLREMIAQLTGAQVAQEPSHERVTWSEYERLAISEALAAGKQVLQVAVEFSPDCAMRVAGRGLLHKVLAGLGEVLAASEAGDGGCHFAVSTKLNPATVRQACQIPGIATKAVVTAVSPSLPHLTSTPEVAEVEGFKFSRREILRVEARRMDAVLNMVGELVIAKSMMQQVLSEFGARFPKDPLRGRMADALSSHTQVLSSLQRAVMKIRMVPVEQLFRRFPRLVRDVAEAGGKDVALAVEGQDTDLDKSILDALAEPLAHLVRNAVDHGVEKPEARIAAGKQPKGTVRLAARHQGNQIVITVGDDGRGVDQAKIVARAIEQGLITREDGAALSESEVLRLIFEPGLSTAEKVTEISGRGVGMDVVRNTVQRLKGTVAVQSEPGGGTTCVLKLPLTVAIIRAMLFRIGNPLYAVPLDNVQEIARVTPDQLHHVAGQEVVQLRSQMLPVVRLSAAAEGEYATQRKLFVAVISGPDKRIALVVDKLAGEEELVIKPLDDELVAHDAVSGASVLGDGTVALILNVAALSERSRGKTSDPVAGRAQEDELGAIV